MVVATQEIEEGEAVGDIGMGTTNQSVKSAPVLVTQLCSLIMVICKFSLKRVTSRAISLVISLAVVTTIYRMAKADFASGPVSQSIKHCLACNSSDLVSANSALVFANNCPSLAHHTIDVDKSCRTHVVLRCNSFDVNTASLHHNKIASLWHSKLGHPNV
ncbi:hypothetical protein ACOSP7_006255 [Xanthoceras sorbifolium]